LSVNAPVAVAGHQKTPHPASWAAGCGCRHGSDKSEQSLSETGKGKAQVSALPLKDERGFPPFLTVRQPQPAAQLAGWGVFWCPATATGGLNHKSEESRARKFPCLGRCVLIHSCPEASSRASGPSALVRALNALARAWGHLLRERASGLESNQSASPLAQA